MTRRPPRSPLFPSTPLSRPLLLLLELRDRAGAATRLVDDPGGLVLLDPLATEVATHVEPLAGGGEAGLDEPVRLGLEGADLDRKSTRLNSSHLVISYAVFCL